ncbi:MAG: hypothetical protein DRG66_08410 [Deltaproteobacteria bacterium]|jgi:hypothetical protein|nr:MAG: hypothetical protein DRG66_08410 [Deltaproteobacteria bacterium]
MYKFFKISSLFEGVFHVIFSEKMPVLHAVKEETDDDRFIECAVGLKADFVISGDRSLTGIQDYMVIRIITPKEFLDICLDMQIYRGPV